MNRLKAWLIRRVVMNRLKAFFGGVIKTDTSEFWTFWAGVALMVLCKFVPPVCIGLTWVGSQLDPPVSPSVLVAGLLTYAVGRMTSKAAKAT